MSYEITIPSKYLAAIRVLTAKEDVRSYLKGVAISKGHIVGTTGIYLGAIDLTGAVPGVEKLPEVIIPNDAIDFFIKKIGRANLAKKNVTIMWEENGPLTLHSNGVIENSTPIGDVRYPDFFKVLPTHTYPTGTPQFQWHFLSLFEKVAELLGVNKKEELKVVLIPNGNDVTARVLIPILPEFNGAIAPIRYKEVYDAVPSLKDTPETGLV